MKSPEHIIARNHPWCDEYEESSFVGRLHEDAVWNDEEYWELEWAMYELSRRQSFTQEIARRIFKIYSDTSLSLSCQFDPNDVFRIKHRKECEIRELQERIGLVFYGFFSGEMPDQDLFEVANPLLRSVGG